MAKQNQKQNKKNGELIWKILGQFFLILSSSFHNLEEWG